MHEMERESESRASVGRRGPVWLWAVWALYLAVWTVALLTPEPARVNTEVLPPRAQFPAAKALHVGSYALLAALACWLPVRPGRRWLLFAVLSFHAFATEFLQQFVELRTGSLTDVGIDHAGVAVGLLAAWCVSSVWKRQVQATGAASLAGTCGRYCAGRSHVHAKSASPAATSKTLE